MLSILDGSYFLVSIQLSIQHEMPREVLQLELGYYSQLLLNYKPLSIKKRVQSPLKILRVICQRPYFTGSGINLINLITETRGKEIEQFIVFGQPADQEFPLKNIIDEAHVNWVRFRGNDESIQSDVDFPIAGMSDQMPYSSTKFSEFTCEMLESYLNAFAETLKKTVKQFKPNLIHSHHLWLVSSLCRVLFPEIPIVASCHNTALRQLVLADHLKRFIINPIKDIDVIAVQSEEQKLSIMKLFNFKEDTKLHVIGQGINTDLFYPSEQKPEKDWISLTYVGKLSNSKGVPQLIQAFREILEETNYHLKLYLVGSGMGPEKDKIIDMSVGLEDKIHFLGQMNQEDLANHLRTTDIFILPSFYDGIPKVLLESLASGCRAIMTNLPGIQEIITSGCGNNDVVQYIPRPKMELIDVPLKEDIPRFINEIKNTLKKQLSCIIECTSIGNFSEKIRSSFGYKTLFEKYIKIYSTFTNNDRIEKNG